MTNFPIKSDLSHEDRVELERIVAIASAQRTSVETAFYNSRLPYLTNEIDEIDPSGNILRCAGNTKPVDDLSGFAKGCIFREIDAVDGTKAVYENQGTTSACDFNLIGDGEPLADNAVTTAKIANNAVTLAKLATGITASHIVKFFALGSTITTTALVGVAVGDIIVTVVADGTVTVAVADTVDTLPADPADTSYVIVFRAVA